MGDYQTLLNVAGLTVRVLDDAPPGPWLLDRCRPFHAAPDAASDPALTIAIHHDPALTLGPDTYDAVAGDEPGAFHVRGYDFSAARRRCGLPIEVTAMPDAGPAGILRWAAGVALLEQGGLLLHAASFAIEGRGVVCAGPSGSGKTTISRLLRPAANVFTDETTAMRFMGGLAMAHATPFAGELGIVSGPASAPVELLAFLRHAAATDARPLRPAEAVSRLMGCAFLPMMAEPWMSATLRLAERLVTAVPCVEFGFKSDASVVDDLTHVLLAPVPSS